MNPTDTSPAHTHCLALFEKLSEYIDKELDASTCREIEAHIRACTPCQVCLGTLQQTVDLCRRLRRHPVPETFHLKLKRSITGLMDPSSGRAASK